jgi:hypothetical protein
VQLRSIERIHYAVQLDAVPPDGAKRLAKYPVVPATLLGRLARSMKSEKLEVLDGIGRSLDHSVRRAVQVKARMRWRSLYDLASDSGFIRPHLLICLKNTLPRIDRPHFLHWRTTRACFRRGVRQSAMASAAWGMKPIVL